MGIKEVKRGQLTIFIILGILIVAIGLLIYFFYPKIKSTGGLETENPYSFIENCLKKDFKESIEKISLSGGSYNVGEDDGYFYRGEYVQYLCYTNENYQKCFNQVPFLKPQIEKEIVSSLDSKIDFCFSSLKESYEQKGYDVQLKKEDSKAEVLPEKLSVKLNRELILTKGDEIKKYKNFELNQKSNLFELTDIASNIVLWEINYGDSLPVAYMMNNPYIKVEKKRKENDIKLYILTDRNTKEVFRFAIRSFAIPAG